VESLGRTVELGKARLVGIRGAVPFSHDQISLRGNELDHWNDTIGIWGSDWRLMTGTVEPGLYYTQHPENANGAAHLIGLEEAQGDVWKFKWGMHKGKYEALVQAEAFKVRRDRDRDGIAEPTEPIDSGDFGIHVHYGGEMWSVGKWSAGCQVLFGGGSADSPWAEFKKVLKATGQSTFDYYLIDGQKLFEFISKP
jgi:hypothetical protein